jgi:hypothetical protein
MESGKVDIVVADDWGTGYVYLLRVDVRVDGCGFAIF